MNAFGATLYRRNFSLALVFVEGSAILLIMKFAGSCSIAATLLLLLAANARSQDTDAAAGKPYASIVARNMFGLLPIPPPDTNPPAAPVDPPPKITLNGIMTIFGRDQALFKVATKPAPGQPAKDSSYVLSEGERQDDIEVTKINHTDGIVTFNNHGTTQELPLVAANSGAAPAGGVAVQAIQRLVFRGLAGRCLPLTAPPCSVIVKQRAPNRLLIKRRARNSPDKTLRIRCDECCQRHGTH